MKIIDLLNKIANDEEVPKKIRIDHWSYKFEWVEHDSNYYDKYENIDLMSCLSMDKEELNYEVHEIEEEKKMPEETTVSEEQMLFNNLNTLDQSFVIKIMKILQQPMDYLKSKGE